MSWRHVEISLRASSMDHAWSRTNSCMETQTARSAAKISLSVGGRSDGSSGTARAVEINLSVNRLMVIKWVIFVIANAVAKSERLRRSTDSAAH